MPRAYISTIKLLNLVIFPLINTSELDHKTMWQENAKNQPNNLKITISH